MNEKEEILKKLNEIRFHDIPVEKISFKTEYSTDFFIEFELYNAAEKDYDHYTMKFIGVAEMKAGKLLMNAESEMEIFSFYYKWNDLFEGKILFLLGFGQPTFEVKIKCSKVELVNTTYEN